MSGPKVFESNGAAKQNQAMRVGLIPSAGPVTVILESETTSTAVAVASFVNQRTSAQVYSDQDTARSAEDTGYDGDGTEKSFSGQALNNLPIVPGSVVIKTATGSTMPNLTDTNADGKLYSPDAKLCGTVDYFTGALVLDIHSSVTAPGSVQINADYRSQATTLKPGGKLNYKIANVMQDDTVEVKAATDKAGGCFIKCNGIATWG